MLKSNTTGNKMFNNANKSIFKQDLRRLKHNTGPRQTVESVKNAATFMRQHGGSG